MAQMGSLSQQYAREIVQPYAEAPPVPSFLEGTASAPVSDAERRKREKMLDVLMPVLAHKVQEQQQREETQRKLDALGMNDILWKHVTNPLPDAMKAVDQVSQFAEKAAPLFLL